MKRIIFCFLSVVAITVAGTSTGFSQDVDKRNLTGFQAISVESGIDVYLKQETKYSVEVVSEGDNADDVVTEVQGDALKIYYRSGFRFTGFRKDKVYVSLPELTDIKCSGGSNVYGENVIKCSQLNINSSGGSDVHLELHADHLSVNCSGGADVDLKGTASRVFVESSGGSDFKGFDLAAEDAELNSSGGSDIQITVRNKLNARSSGGSDIYYKGDPEYVEVDSSGGSDIHKR